MDASAAAWARVVATVAVVVGVDQGSKQLVLHSLSPGERVNVFFGLDITRTTNTGVAFGALRGAGLAVAVLIAVALALLVGYFATHAAMPRLWLPVGLVVGGAVANLVDRARLGAVVDFIDPIAWPAFNLADTSIVIGVLALLYVVEGSGRRGAPR